MQEELRQLGPLLCRRTGDTLLVEARRENDGTGLYKAFLYGAGGGLALGTLLPTEEGLLLRRRLPVSTCRKAGCWPPLGGEIFLHFPFEAKSERTGWRPLDERKGLFAGDALLQAELEKIPFCLYCPEDAGFRLAVPLAAGAFPLTPLFCLACVERRNGGLFAVFSFDAAGRPRLPAGSCAGG